jgi:hypothetical protein
LCYWVGTVRWEVLLYVETLTSAELFHQVS